MRLDFWKADRESATQLDCGLKVLVSELKTKNYMVLQIWRPRAIKPYLIRSYEDDIALRRTILNEIAKYREELKIKQELKKKSRKNREK
jgi:hypothetical protein